MADLTLKANDTRPLVEAQLGHVSVEANAALATALAQPGVAVSFVMRLQSQVSGAPQINKPAQVYDAAERIVRYLWGVADTAKPGVYLAEWEVVFADGSIQTFPTAAYHSIEILKDLDEGGA